MVVLKTTWRLSHLPAGPGGAWPWVAGRVAAAASSARRPPRGPQAGRASRGRAGIFARERARSTCATYEWLCSSTVLLTPTLPRASSPTLTPPPPQSMRARGLKPRGTSGAAADRCLPSGLPGEGKSRVRGSNF
jgi:hypothetical protein